MIVALLNIDDVWVPEIGLYLDGADVVLCQPGTALAWMAEEWAKKFGAFFAPCVPDFAKYGQKARMYCAMRMLQVCDKALIVYEKEDRAVKTWKRHAENTGVPYQCVRPMNISIEAQ